MSKPYVPAWLAVFDRILIGTALLTGGALLAFMTIFGTINVLVMRKLLNNPVVGTEDLMILALVVVAAISIPFGGRVGAHIEIEVLERFFPRWFDFASRVILRAIGAVLMAVMALQLVEAGHSAVRFGETTQQLLISYAPFYYILAGCVALYALVLIADIVQLLMRGQIAQIPLGGEALAGDEAPDGAQEQDTEQETTR